MLFDGWLITGAQASEDVVEVATGGAAQAAAVLAARFGVAIDYEDPGFDPTRELEVAYNRDSDVYFPVRPLTPLRFSYPHGSDADTALRALVEAWNATGAPGTPYLLEVNGPTRRLRPTTHTLPDGTRAPWTSPLACDVSLDPVTGLPEHRVALLLQALRDQCGVGVVWGPSIIAPPTEAYLTDSSQPHLWRFPAFKGPAADALDQLSLIVGGGGYRLYRDIWYHPGGPARFSLPFTIPDADDDRLYSLQPLGQPARPRPPDGRGVVDMSWSEYVAWWNAHPEHQLGGSAPDTPLGWPSLAPTEVGPFFGDHPLPDSFLDPIDDPTEHPKSLGVPTPR